MKETLSMKNMDHKLMWPAILFILAVMILAIIFPDAMKSITAQGSQFVTHKLGFLIQLVALGCVAVLAWLAFGKYGSVRFGGQDAKPQFSYMTFAFMMFTAGVGAGLIYWSVGEPLNYMLYPPYGIEPLSVDSTKWAIAYSIYHWNIIGWSIFLLPAIPYGYYLHNRKKRNMRLSALCSEVIGKQHENSWLGYAINIFAIFGTLGAFSTSMGLSAELLGAGLYRLFGIESTILVKVSIVFSFIIFYIFVMLAGLKKGISKLADVCVYIAVGMIIFVFLTGPTSFIINYFADSLGIILNNFFRMSFYTDPINQSGFPQGWSIFYWAWYLAYLVMMGLFIARVSKGRTFRQTILTCVVGSSFGCSLFLGILGGYTVHGQITGAFPFVSYLTERGLSQAVIDVITSVPYGNIILVVFLVAAYFLITTTMTSATYAVSMMTTKDLDPDEDPDLSIRLIWSIAVGCISMVALLMGGSIDTIKSMAIISAPPMIILYVIMTMCLFKWLKQDYIDMPTVMPVEKIDEVKGR